MEIVVGTKTWSTWSMRPWLVLKRAGLPFRETLVDLRQEDGVSEAAIRAHSPSGLVPVLKDGDLTIWDSMAICEYLADLSPNLWPKDQGRRALARAAAAEMHSGFPALRRECPMDLSAAPRAADLTAEARKDVARIVAVWSELLARFGGPFLIGPWSIADAVYTPVATRFRTYGVRVEDHGGTAAAAEYVRRLLSTPEFLAWESDARR